MSFKIGNVKINGQVITAPMAGFSNTTFRKIFKSYQAALVVGEMVSDKAICYGNNKTLDLLQMSAEERPISQQIFGNDVKSFVKAAKIVEEKMQPDIIDINMGCPVPKIAIKNASGSALLKNPLKVKEIVAAVVKSVKVPVTVKIRSGWDNNSINAVQIAKICEEAGAKAITIHGKTRQQGFSGQVDLDIIKQVVDAVKIPVIGNGDIKSIYDAKKMLEKTGCAAVMVGRAILGKPWLIKEIDTYLKTGEVLKSPSLKEKIALMKYHLTDLVKIKGEKLAVLEMRGILNHYLKGMTNTKIVKKKISLAKSAEEIINILDDYEKSSFFN